MKEVLRGHEDRVIINIANEWRGTAGAEAWASGYIHAVRSLRQAGLKHLLVVDSPGWGQDAPAIPQRGASIFKADRLHR